MNRRSVVLWFVMFLAGFVVNFGTVQLLRLTGFDRFASPIGVSLGCVAVVIVQRAGARWEGRSGSSNQRQ